MLNEQAVQETNDYDAGCVQQNSEYQYLIL